METQHTKTYRCNESSSKRHVYTETRKIPNNITLCFREVEKKEQTEPKVSRIKKMIKRRNKWNREQENDRKIYKTENWFFENKQNWQTFSWTHQGKQPKSKF